MKIIDKIRRQIHIIKDHPNYSDKDAHGDDALCLRCQVITLEKLLEVLEKK